MSGIITAFGSVLQYRNLRADNLPEIPLDRLPIIPASQLEPLTSANIVDISLGEINADISSKADLNGSLLQDFRARVVEAEQFHTFSDRRLKTNVEPLHVDPQILEKVVPVTFQMNNKREPGELPVRTGFIAQNILECLPTCVREDSLTGFYSIETNGLVAALWTLVQQLSQRVSDLEGLLQKSEQPECLS